MAAMASNSILDKVILSTQSPTFLQHQQRTASGQKITRMQCNAGMALQTWGPLTALADVMAAAAGQPLSPG